MTLLLEMEPLRKRIEELPVETYPEGAVILSDGGRTGKIFILVSGTAKVMKGDISIGEVTEPGAVLGEIAALLDQPHGAEVRAVTACQFRVAEAASFLRDDPVAALFVATVMARRLSAANQALVEVRREVAAGQPRGVIGRALDKLADSLRLDADPELARYMYGGWM